MTRITPRTCLWPLTGSLILTFSLSIALTFVSDHHCYAGTCGETLFLLQARLHVVIWYCWIVISVTVLGIRAFSPRLRSILRKALITEKLPYLSKHLSVSGVLLMAWIITLYAIIVGVWWTRLHVYFRSRGRENGVHVGNNQLAAIALTGHLCDVTMGMVLLPISRHSALASFFKLSVSTTITFHMITAYTLFILVLSHGLLYVSWIPVYHRLSAHLRQVFPVLNPTYIYSQTWPGDRSAPSVWRASLVFTGLFSLTIMVLVFFTSLPTVRAKHFNVFYFTHLTVIIAVIVVCLHASTMWYCLSPGLIMWLLDWTMRLYELRTPLDGQIITYGSGWYCINIALPRHRLHGCACTSPLAHFYLHHADSSIRELHPFTTISHLGAENRITSPEQDDLHIQFLFRKRGLANRTLAKPSAKDGFATAVLKLFSPPAQRKPQWTNQLAELAHIDTPTSREPSVHLVEPTSRNNSAITFGADLSHPATDIKLRLEGPYFTPADPAKYRTVICFVAGTGISGALAIAAGYRENTDRVSTPDYICEDCRRQGHIPSSCSTIRRAQGHVWKKCIILWSVKDENFVDLPFLNAGREGLEVVIQRTGKGRPRVNVLETLQGICKENPGSVWVYISGPNPFIIACEEACKMIKRVDYYGARW